MGVADDVAAYDRVFGIFKNSFHGAGGSSFHGGIDLVRAAGRVKLAWDENHVYVCAEVKDKTPEGAAFLPKRF